MPINESESDDRARRGAWRAGYECGFQDGRESLYREGWREIKTREDVKEGDIIKLLTTTVFGWKGVGRVQFVTFDGINAVRLDKECTCHLKDTRFCFCRSFDCCFHEAVVKDDRVKL